MINDVNKQFAEYFPSDSLKPYLYLLFKRLSEGHICLPIAGINETELANTDYTLPLPGFSLLNEPLVSDGHLMRPFVLFNDQLYLQRYFRYESLILQRIQAFIEDEKDLVEERSRMLVDQSDFLKEIFENSAQKLTNRGDEINWPLAAAVMATLNNFTIITGGPGTGKTTTVAKVLSLLFSIYPTLKVALCAPTGKAATRMAESLKNAVAFASPSVRGQFEKLVPATIHRLLGTTRGPYFKHHKENVLPYDVIIADEASMIDVALFAKLLDAIGPSTRLLLLGDKDQLASVEAGSLFGDLCKAQSRLNTFSPIIGALINSFISDPAQRVTADYIEKGNGDGGEDSSRHLLFEHIVELKKSHRFSDDEGIGKFSKVVLQNNWKGNRYFFSNTDEQVKIDTLHDQRILEDFIKGYDAFIQEKDILLALQKLGQLRVLCAVREGPFGLYALNKKIEHFLQQKRMIQLTGDFYHNRPVMVTSNNRELQLSNGDIGLIRPDENGTLKAWFETGNGELKSVLPGYITHVETVYAMTIHKSQGSEFDEVLVVLPKGEQSHLLTKELLYTAVTRAKKRVIIQGSEQMILRISGISVQRASGIIQRIADIKQSTQS